MSPDLAALLAEPIFWLAIASAALGGLVRGFSGFGGGLVFIPIMSALYEPRVAVACLFLMDVPLSLSLVARVFRRIEWSHVFPLVLGSWLMVPVGAFILTHADAVPMRWAISALILVALAALMSGYRWHGHRNLPTTVAVGGSAGFLSGLASLGGPPVIIYWLGRADPAGRIRANVIGFFLFNAMAAGTAFLLNGLFTAEILEKAVFLVPTYGICGLLGGALFRPSSEFLFRGTAYVLIATAALAGLPAFDGWLR